MFWCLCILLGQCSGVGGHSQIQGEVCHNTNLQTSYAIATYTTFLILPNGVIITQCILQLLIVTTYVRMDIYIYKGTGYRHGRSTKFLHMAGKLRVKLAVMTIASSPVSLFAHRTRGNVHLLFSALG